MENTAVEAIPIGAITYSFRQMPIGPGSTLMYLRQAGLGHAELMDYDLEVEAGAPVWKCPWDHNEQDQADRAQWRAKVGVEAFEEVRARYAEAGVRIHILKPGFHLSGDERQTDEEIEYCFRAAKAVGAACMTREIPAPANFAEDEKGLRRIARFCDKYDMLLAFHNHEQINATTYDGPLLDVSDRFRINFDIGHYVASNDDDPLAFVRKYHDKIYSIHLKDRTTKAHRGQNLVFGQGDTPLQGLFALLRRENWPLHCDIEMEYAVPVGSSAAIEVMRSATYVKLLGQFAGAAGREG